MEDILERLQSSGADESEWVANLRVRADQLLASTRPDTCPSSLPSTLHDLLISIIKPLFSKSQHPSITSTGRKNLVAKPTVPDRFGSDSIFDPPPPWKNDWTVPLFSWITTSYGSVDEPERRKVVEEHFHLLIPPLLNLIDDAEIVYKARGCDCLRSFCDVLYQVQSDMLKRTGLTEVFVDALKNCFHYLPTLTPEEESVTLLKSLYPAYLALVRARFVMLELLTRPVPATVDRATLAVDAAVDPHITTVSATSTTTQSRLSTKMQTGSPHQPSSSRIGGHQALTPSQVSAETSRRTKDLTLILRHSLLYSISHLSSHRGSAASTTSPILTTFLLRQIGPVLEQMGIYAVTHLQSILPLLVDILRDPFATTVAPTQLLDAAVEALEKTTRVCWVRVRERWWMDCLHGCVDGWLAIWEEYLAVRRWKAERANKTKQEKEKGLDRVRRSLERYVVLLRHVVGCEEFDQVARSLAQEETQLRQLFRGEVEREDEGTPREHGGGSGGDNDDENKNDSDSDGHSDDDEEKDE